MGEGGRSTSRASCWTLPAPWTRSREKRSLKCPMHSDSDPVHSGVTRSLNTTVMRERYVWHPFHTYPNRLHLCYTKVLNVPSYKSKGHILHVNTSVSTWVVFYDVAESFQGHLGPLEPLGMLLGLYLAGLGHSQQGAKVLGLGAHIVQQTSSKHLGELW